MSTIRVSVLFSQPSRSEFLARFLFPFAMFRRFRVEVALTEDVARFYAHASCSYRIEASSHSELVCPVSTSVTCANVNLRARSALHVSISRASRIISSREARYRFFVTVISRACISPLCKRGRMRKREREEDFYLWILEICTRASRKKLRCVFHLLSQQLPSRVIS